MSIQGHVKTWNVAKGYGFLTSNLPDGSEAFAHHSNIPGPGLIVGQPVSYEVESHHYTTAPPGAKKLVAINITGPGVIPPPHSPGHYRGVVALWVSGRSMGLIRSSTGEEVHVHSSGFGGGSLVVGGQVTFDVLNEVHLKTGKRIAYNVRGPGVVAVGQMTGKVKAWISSKGYGFTELADGSEVFIHRTALSNGHCVPGRTIYFDLQTQDHTSGRELAVNVTGPGVRPGSAAPVGKGAVLVGGKGGAPILGAKGGKGVIGGKGGKGFKGGKGGGPPAFGSGSGKGSKGPAAFSGKGGSSGGKGYRGGKGSFYPL